ncbi:MAG TPA: hypothetical protein VMO26_05570 [Vicinamibacterales bacterium]|nr:hypothetical protein [Vicinamibacterales bacterium]
MRTAILLMVAVIAVSGRQAQPAPDVESAVTRLGAYLLEYEKQLSTVIAQERYRQSETRPRTGRTSLASGIGSITTRTLESEVAFLRLPGDLEWYGVRNVLRVNGKPVESSSPRLLDAMQALAVDRDALIEAIVHASSVHNLGASRTINMPTVPLELLHPRNRARFSFRLAGTATISRTPTRELRFQEQSTPSLVQDVSGRHLLAEGSVWIEPASGQLWRVVVRFDVAHQSVRHGQTAPNELRVDFARDATLGLMVPKELREDLQTLGGGRVQGRAMYSQFRRFTTSARILPPPGAI